MPGLRLLVGIVALVAVVVTFRVYFLESGAIGGLGGGPAMLAGAPAQSYAVGALHGGSDSLANYRGKVVLLNLWASWCAPCRSETPALEQLYEADRAKGLVVLGVDQGESADAAGAFAREMRLTYPILLDRDQAYGRAYVAVGLPTSIVVDRGGHILRGIDGEMTLAQMQDAVDSALRRAQ